jgi:hypothetical protein
VEEAALRAARQGDSPPVSIPAREPVFVSDSVSDFTSIQRRIHSPSEKYFEKNHCIGASLQVGLQVDCRPKFRDPESQATGTTDVLLGRCVLSEKTPTNQSRAR